MRSVPKYHELAPLAHKKGKQLRVRDVNHKHTLVLDARRPFSWGMWPGNNFDLLKSKDQLEYWNFPCSKFSYMLCSFQRTNTKEISQTAQIWKLICAFVVRMQHNQVPSRWGPTWYGPVGGPVVARIPLIWQKHLNTLLHPDDFKLII